MFRLKVCGVTSPTDARMCVELGADALGLNFFPSSPRCLTVSDAQEIVRAIPAHVASVGLFVNADAAWVRELAGSLPLDFIQLHGDEPPEALADFAGLPMIRALRLGKHNLDELIQYVDEASRLEFAPVAWLIDGWTPGQYGGAGKSTPMDEAIALKGRLAGAPLVLAGGLNPDNIAAAIAALQPDAVDVCSGVESSPGVKDPDRTRAFLGRAAALLESI